MMWEWLIEGAATFAEYLCALYFIQDSEPKDRFKMVNIAIAAPITIYILITNMSQLFSYNAILGYLLYLFLISFLMYRKNWIDKMLLSFLMLLLITICDYASMPLMGIATGHENYVAEIMDIHSACRKYFLLLDKSLLVLCTVLVKRYMRSYITQEKYKFLIAFGTVGVLLAYVTCNFSGMYALLGWSIYVIMAFAMAMTFCFYRKWQDAEITKELLQMKNTTYMEYYGDLCRRQEEKERLLHDMRYHYLNLFQLLEDRKYEECSEYLNRISGAFDKGIFMTFTGNQYMDFIINFKKHEAEELGIEVGISADIVGESVEFRQEDINIILGNLLDNAIEACQAMKEGERRIEIRINKMKQMLFITIKNSFGELPKMLNGELVTQKANPQIHGLGLKNVRDRVEKYNGTFDIDYSGNIFSVEITIFL